MKLNNAYSKTFDIANKITKNASNSLEVALADHLYKVTEALYGLEREWSGNNRKLAEQKIRDVVGSEIELESTIKKALDVRDELTIILERIKNEV